MLILRIFKRCVSMLLTFTVIIVMLLSIFSVVRLYPLVSPRPELQLSDFLELSLSLANVLIAITLGFVVYRQSERINRLESSLYDPIISITKSNNNVMPSQLIEVFTNHNTRIIKTPVDYQHFSLITNIKWNNSASNATIDVNLPLAFNFKRVDTTSLSISKIKFKLTPAISQGNVFQIIKYSKTFRVHSKPIYHHFQDGSSFVWHFRVTQIPKEQYDLWESVVICLNLNVTDSLSRTHYFNIKCSFENVNGDFWLVSTQMHNK